MDSKLRPCWLNCYAPDDERFPEDEEIPVIDAMEDTIAPLDDKTKALRQLITRFEACYHEADKETEYIIRSIAAGHCLEQSDERPPMRKQELQNCRDILSAWCENSFDKVRDMDIGGIPADTLDTSLPSKRFYDSLGYATLEETFLEVENGKKLDYYKMEKSLMK